MKNLGVIGKKIGMMQLFVEDGVCVPVTVLQITPNAVVQKRTEAVDGYTALQLGAGDIREKLVNLPKKGHFKKAGVEPKRHLVEFRVSSKEAEAYEMGASIGMDLFKDVVSVDVAATSKGKGYAGVMKRHNFSGFRATHGTHEFFRHGGSIGCRAKPGKVFKGKRMSGHMGDERVTVINLRVIRFMAEEGLLCVRGAVPGGKGSMVEIRPSTRKAKALHGVAGAQVEEGLKNPMKAAKAGAKGKK